MSGISHLGKSDQRSMPENIRPVPLTQIAHSIADNFFTASSFAIDATVGNGHDAMFLAKGLGSSGRVHGFDIQADAITSTREILDAEGLLSRTVLHNIGHQRMSEVLPQEMERSTGLIFFNLGYLPGGDKSVTTLLSTTLDAVALAWQEYLSLDGLLSIMAYPGHPTGKTEAEGVVNWLGSLEDAQIYSIPSPGPTLYLLHHENTQLREIMEATGIF